MVVSHRHIIMLALLLASPTVARAAETAEGTATVPRFEPAPCPKLPGTEQLAKASCGYLVVPENHNRPSGRTIRLMAAKYPARSAEAISAAATVLAGVLVTAQIARVISFISLAFGVGVLTIASLR